MHQTTNFLYVILLRLLKTSKSQNDFATFTNAVSTKFVTNYNKASKAALLNAVV